MSSHSFFKFFERIVIHAPAILLPIVMGAFFLLPTIADAGAKGNQPFAKKLIQSARTVTTPPLGRTSFGIGFKNTSGVEWKTTGADVPTLRSSSKKESYFHAPSWMGKNVVMTLPHATKPGEIVYFWFTLEAPKREGDYTEEFALYEGPQKIAETVTRIPIRVKTQTIATDIHAGQPSSVQTAALQQKIETPPSVSPAQQPTSSIQPLSLEHPSSDSGAYVAVKLIQSAPSVTIKQAERTTFGIGFKNVGSAVWKKGDASAVSLHSSAKKESYFYDPSWKTQNVVMNIPTDAQPGELVYFWFTLFAPVYPGTYEEKLFLEVNGKKIEGSDVSIPMSVVPKSSTVLTSVSGQAGQDIGSKTIETALPPSPPTSDTSSDIPTVIPTAVQPARPGIIDERTEQEPFIRVGLFSTKDPVRITADKDYEVRDSDGTLLTVERAGSVSAVVFDWVLKVYTLTTPKVSLGTNKYLRFGAVQSDIPQSASTPDQGIIFEIPSYTNHPSWSSALNDNTFRTTLEVRYAPQTNRLWVVNELKLENYLKGIGETSNSSPYEYQKTLIVAARTYAKYHVDRSTKHAADGFTVSPTEADQVYRGYGAEKRLPNVSRAVDETQGVIVTYGGQLAITPYYSQSDGRTRSWEEAWGGEPKPWLVSRPDPYCEGLVMLGHGVGMSARGAIGMALDSKSFEEILKYYYTGIELKRVY